MRKVDDGEEKKRKKKEKKKRMAFLVATTSLPAVYRPNDDRWNAARSCQYFLTRGIRSCYPYLGGGPDSVDRRGGAKSAPPKKSMKELCQTPGCYI